LQKYMSLPLSKQFLDNSRVASALLGDCPRNKEITALFVVCVVYQKHLTSMPFDDK